MSKSSCPCGSGKSYVVCCKPLHDGKPAGSAEALMRSRYSAFVLLMGDYLLASWHSSTRPESIEVDDGSRWLGLKVKSTSMTADNRATVQFVARYRENNSLQRLQETSRFIKEGKHWYYLDGDVQ